MGLEILGLERYAFEACETSSANVLGEDAIICHLTGAYDVLLRDLPDCATDDFLIIFLILLQVL